MSRTPTESMPERQPDMHRNDPEREPTAGTRAGLTREAARAEMDRFRGVAEYETRKIFGQRSALRQPLNEAEDAKPTERKTQAEATEKQ